jgi:hypothetical protein
MPVEGAIPQLAGIDTYGNSIPAGRVGGDLFEYIHFSAALQHRRPHRPGAQTCEALSRPFAGWRAIGWMIMWLAGNSAVVIERRWSSWSFALRCTFPSKENFLGRFQAFEGR